MLNLPEKVLKNMISILSKERNVEQALLFGSRARGEARDNSDIDIALIGTEIPIGLNTKLRDAAGLYTLDIIRLDKLENESLFDQIMSDGIVIYSKEETAALA